MRVPFSLLFLAILIVLGVWALVRGRSPSRWGMFWRILGAFLLAVPCGGFAYLFVGIGIARARHVGQFFSVPFGGYVVRDSAIAGSLLAWTALFFFLIALLFRAISSRRSPSSSGSHGENN